MYDLNLIPGTENKKDKYKDVKQFFKENVPDLHPDKHMLKDLHRFRLQWSTKDHEYIDFLGSNLLGVHTIRFSNLDDDKLMTEIFNIRHWKSLQEELYEVKDMERNFNTGSNIIYVTLTYLMHLTLKDNKLNKNDKEKLFRELCLILQYKMFSSLYAWYFKFKTTEAIALTVYNKLSHKFLIKQLNSWQEVFEYRVKTCLEKDNPNYPRLNKLDTVDTIRIISDIQTKLREQVKQIFAVLMEVIENNETIKIESSTYVGGENNEEQIGDVTNGISNYIRRIKDIIYQPNELIDRETLEIVSSLFNNIEQDIIYRFLKCISDENFTKKDKKFMDYIETILLESMDYLQRNNINIEQREYIPKALVMVRYYWSSSKVKNDKMDEVKKYLQKKSRECTHKKTAWVNVAVTISFVTYIFLRSLKK